MTDRSQSSLQAAFVSVSDDDDDRVIVLLPGVESVVDYLSKCHLSYLTESGLTIHSILMEKTVALQISTLHDGRPRCSDPDDQTVLRRPERASFWQVAKAPLPLAVCPTTVVYPFVLRNVLLSVPGDV